MIHTQDQPIYVGTLIKNYRKEKGLSQVDVEVGIGAAFGSITKIETGKISPSKETLYKIIDFLDLAPVQAMKLFNIDVSILGQIIENLDKIYNYTSLNEVMDFVLNDVRAQLGLAGGAFYLIEKNKLYLKSLSSTRAMTLATRIVKNPFSSLIFDLQENTDNMLVKAALTNQVYFTDSLYEVIKPKITKWLADRVQQISNTKELVILPIVSNNKVIGLITYGLLANNYYYDEIDILKKFVKEIGKVFEKIAI